MRKQLLLAESELNRAHLSREGQALADAVRGLTAQASTVAWASAAAWLALRLAAARPSRASAQRENPSWFQKVLQAAQWANSILQVCHAAAPQRQADDTSNRPPL